MKLPRLLPCLITCAAASFPLQAMEELISPRPFDIIKTRSGTIEGKIVIDAPGEKEIWVLEPGSNIKRPVRRDEIIEILRRQTVREAYEQASRKASGNISARRRLFLECLRKRLFDLALEESRKMLSEAPDAPETLTSRIQALLRAGRAAEAARFAEKAVGSGSRDTSLLIAAGRAFLAAGAPRDAIRAFQAAREAAGDDPAPLTGMARAFLEAGLTGEAEETARRALSLAPSDYEALLVLGDVLMAKGDADAAAETFLRARKTALLHSPPREDRDARALVGLGAARYVQGRLEDARSALLEALDLRPGNAPAFYDLGLVYAASGKPEQAYKYFRWANQPSDSIGLAYAALAHLVYSDSPLGALDHARKAVEVSPDDPYCNYVLAYFLYLSGEMKAAGKALEQAAGLAPGALDVALARAAVLLKSDAPEKALRLYEEAFRKWRSPAALTGIGLALAAENRLEEAEEKLSSALSIAAPGSRERLDALLGLGYVANLRSLRDEAKRRFLLALSERGDCDYALNALSLMFEQEGRNMDFYGFEGAAPLDGWKVSAPFGITASVQNGRLVLKGVQERSDGGLTEAAFRVSSGAFESAACDIFVPGTPGDWEGGFFLQSGAFRLVAAHTGKGALAWRYKDPKRGWRKWTETGRVPSSGKIHIEIKTVRMKERDRSVQGVALFLDGKETARIPAGRSLGADGVRLGLYSSALIGREVRLEMDNLVVISLGSRVE